MDRSQKVELVSTLREGVEASSIVIVTQQLGLTVDEVNDLRRKMRGAGANYKVAKNTLARLAVEGTQCASLSSVLTGPTAIAFAQDPVGVAKVAVEFANKNEKLKVVGGVMNGQYLDAKAIETLSKLPSLDELRAKILGIITTPATRIAGVVQAPAGQLARVFGAYGKTA